MDTRTARALIELNNRFYAEHAESFSATRTEPWEGWTRVASLVRRQIEKGDGCTACNRVLDLAGGNLRFERFLATELPDCGLEFHAVDDCPALMEPNIPGLEHLTCHRCDVLNALLGQDGGLPPIPSCSLAVSFGFMHHVPGTYLRHRVLEALLDSTAPKGLIVLSFWQFMDDGRLARKVHRAEELLRMQGTIDMAQLDENDHFLGWQSDPSPIRYCHHFDEREIDCLVSSVGTSAREIARYSADGASGTLNRYLVLERGR